MGIGSSAPHSLAPSKISKPTALRTVMAARAEGTTRQSAPRIVVKFGGLSIVVGRVRNGRVFGGVKYVALGHNTVRGAAGCALLIAESKSQGYI